jgi:hypothetical protein
MTEPTVPNWIAKAIVTDSRRSVAHAIRPGWRATRTQVIVSTEHEQEIRFRLGDLREVGKDRYSPNTYYLVPPTDAKLLAAEQRRALDRARNGALDAVEKARLQDGTDDLDSVLAKLETVRQAVVKAQASLADLS